jgi:CubicO group peptidase (beta-lactamase class C family)
MQRWQVPGVALGVLHDGQEHTAGFGVTNVEHPLPVTPTTLFQIGSISKTFTGTAIMRLVAQQRLNLDIPICTYLPELRLRDPQVETNVTLRHVLTHTAGFVGDLFTETGSGDDALARYVARMADLEQLTPLGTTWSYCNSGFGLAGRVIEVVTGKPCETAIRDLVFTPLGLDAAWFFPAEVMTHRFVVGHLGGPSGPAVARPWQLARNAAAVGGITTHVGMLLRYARFHLGNGTAQFGEELIPRSLLDEMQREQAPAGNFADAVGITWMLRDIGNVRCVQHGGATNGQIATFVMVPQHNFAFTLLTNAAAGNPFNQELSAAVLRHYLGAATPEPTYLTLDEAELQPYAGTYAAFLNRLEVTVQNGALVAQVVPLGGFPFEDSPPNPPPPATRLAFTAPDRLVALDSPFRGNRAEVLRAPDGSIAWIRNGGRIHRRIG